MDIQLERSLIKQSKKDPEAFGQLFDHYYPQIYRFIYKRVGNVELAQDLTSEVFFQALKNIWRYKITKKPFSAWLYRIAVVQIAQFYRHKEKHCEITLDVAPQLIAHESFAADASIAEQHDEKETKELFEQLHHALLKLSKVQHTVLILRYFENKRINEIAQILAVKENTIKSHIRRGLAKLESILSDDVSITIQEYAKHKFANYRRIFTKGGSSG